jgi:hypothetical protein
VMSMPLKPRPAAVKFDEGPPHGRGSLQR